MRGAVVLCKQTNKQADDHVIIPVHVNSIHQSFLGNPPLQQPPNLTLSSWFSSPLADAKQAPRSPTPPRRSLHLQQGRVGDPGLVYPGGTEALYPGRSIRTNVYVGHIIFVL